MAIAEPYHTENADFASNVCEISLFMLYSFLYFLHLIPIVPMSAEKNGLYIFEGLTQKEIAYFIMMSETLHFSKGDTIISE